MLKNQPIVRFAAIVSAFFVIAISASAQVKKKESRTQADASVASSEMPQYRAIRPEAPYASLPVTAYNDFSPLAVNNYAPTRTTGITYTSISGTGTSVASWRNGTSLDDNLSNNLPIGFTFIYNGGAYQNFRISTNGFMTFNTTSTAIGSGSTSPYSFPNTALSSASTATDFSPTVLAPMWDDLTVPAAGTLAGNIKYLTTGVAPNRILTVEWIGMEVFANAGPDLNFQVKLYEVDGHIEYVYGTMTPSTATYTYSTGMNAQTLSTTPTVAELLTQQTANTATFSNTPSNALATVPAVTSQITFTPTLVTPTAPTNLTFPTVGASFAALNWTDNATNETNYNVLISTDGGVTYSTFGAIFGANTTGITVSGLAPSTAYFFRILACTEAICSAPLDNSVTTNAPISGTKTIGPGGDYTTFGFAISDVNNALGGPVTFNVAPGTTFPENGTCITGGTVTNTVLFQKNGAGPNPVIQPPGSSSAQDSGICILGGDFVTFDGIDVNGNAGGLVEFGALVFNLSATNGAQNNTIKNSKITLNRTNTSSRGIIQTLSIAATAASGANSNNKYYNITVENAAAGIFLNGTSTTILDTANEIGVTGGGTTTVGAATANDIGNGTAQTWGIRATAQSGVKIFNAEVRNVTGTGTAAVDGIFLDNSGSGTTSVGTNQIFNNKVHDVNNTNTAAGVVRGIRENLTNNAGSVSQIFNNFIWNLDSASTVTATRRIIGINIQDGGTGTASTHNIDFNSVRLAPTGLACSNATFEIGTSSNIMKVRNNIFANFSGAQSGSAKHYTWVTTSSTTIGAATSLSDRNDLYIANPTNGFVALTSATDRVDLAAWQAAITSPAGAGDPNGKSGDPQFLSATNLHINPALPTVVESNGSFFAGAITWAGSDIDADVRNAATPDIGADEGTFTVIPPNDIAATAIVTPVTGTAFLNPGSSTASASFRNTGTATQTGISVQFTITGPGGYSYLDNTQVIASLAAGASTTVTFVAPPSFTTAGTYTTTASVLTPDAFPANDSVGGSFTVFDPISGGTVSVGTGQPYTSLTNPGGIFAAINAATVTSPIVVNITSDLTGETGVIALNQFASPNTVVIKPSGGIRTVSGSAATSLILLNGADNVTIDGSLSGGTDRSLTINNTNASGVSVVSLASLGAGLGSTGNTVKNTNIVGGADTSVSTTDTFGIFSGGTGTPSTILDGADNDNNTFDNNAVTKARYGIYLRGVSTNANDNNVISGNTVGSAAFNTSRISKAGIVVQHQNAISITRNEVRFVGIQITDAGGGTDRVGIGVGDFGWTPTTTVITNATVTRNLIHDIVEEKTFSSVGIVLGPSGTLATNNLVSNNMMYGIRANGTAGDQSVGIGVAGGDADKVVFNSIAMTGDIDPVTSTTATQSAVGARVSAATVTNLAFMNNIMSVDVSSNTTTLKHYAFVKPSATYSFGTGGSNYNDYFVNASNTQMVLFGNGTSVPYTDVTTLGAFQGEAPAHDANSQVNDPKFVSATDLHLNAATTPLLGDGTGVLGVSNDYDNDPRPSAPDIGADEVVQADVGNLNGGTYYNASLVNNDFVNGTVTITNTLYMSGISSAGKGGLISLGCTANVVGYGPSSYFVGGVRKDYCGPQSFTYPIGTTPDNVLQGETSVDIGPGPPPEYSPFVANVTAGTFPSSLTVVSIDAVLPGSNSSQSASRYWDVFLSGNLTADISFTYLNQDVLGIETGYQVLRRELGITNVYVGGTVNDVTNTGSATGVTNFSQWAAGNLAPTAANVRVSGRVMTPEGAGLRNATVQMTDSRGVTRTAQTATFGYYSFDDVNVGETYIIRIQSRRFVFTPRVIQVNDEISGLDFIADQSQ